ncbi:hypothetical protein PF011_g3580 [Phytophthora fragariae]|uniref:Uncharacterized protein n=1 Tax=Phytophthora fragariae TaxID=53985 RepID=A0A6A3M1S5_9STRA|nr:hypothetical protein PF011_g3580 [Phytophthora fragariae]
MVAPFSSKIFTTCAVPFAAAVINAVSPSSSASSTNAPNLRRNFTTSTLSFSLAIWRAE